MRQAALALAIALVVAGSSEAQYRGRAPAGRTYGSPSGFGNILFPGVGTAPPMVHSPFLVPGPTFAQRLGSTIGGGGYPATARPPRTPGRQQQAAYPYAVPVYYGYGYGGGFGSGYSAVEQPPVTIVNETPPQPTVIINQYYTPDGRPSQNQVQDGNSGGVRSYQAPVPSNSEPEAFDEPRSLVSEQKPTLYLIAYRDGSIYATLAYWIEGDTLNYITAQGAHNRASLDLIDRALSEQLNRERRVDFSLSVVR